MTVWHQSVLQCSNHLCFTSVSTLAWVGRVLLDGSLPCFSVLGKARLQIQFSKIISNQLCNVLRGLPLLRTPSIAIYRQPFTGFAWPILSTCSNHLNMFCLNPVTGILSLFLSSFELFRSLRLTLHIYLTICMSVRNIL